MSSRRVSAVAFNDIDIDCNEIEQSLLNIENKVRTNLFSWNGQFSPQFIEALIEKYVNEDDVVFDPFLGSGTILYECARKNISAIGIELNPSAYYMAKAYEFCSLEQFKRQYIIREIDAILSEIKAVDAILDTLNLKISAETDEYLKNALSLIIVLLDIFNNELSFELLSDKWNKLKRILLSLPFTHKTISACLGDARQTPFLDNSVDVIITSPPYINVFNYHQKYRRSVEALGYNVLQIAKKEVGSNRKHRGNRILTVIQYCIDMALALQEMIRVGNPDARFILVVGHESNVLSISFCNSELIYEIACQVFDLEFIVKQQRVFKNKFGQMIYEDILHFGNKKDRYETLCEDDIIAKARTIAKTYLLKKLDETNTLNNNYEFLVSAIESISQVNKSEG